MPNSNPVRTLDRPQRPGFALPAVLAVTGVVTLVFLVAITALASLTAEAASARARVRFMQRALTAEATLSYMAATEPMKADGLALNDVRIMNDFEMGAPEAQGSLSGVAVEPVKLDGRPYLMDIDGPLVASLRDQAGMLNLSLLFGQPFERLMERLGVERSQINPMSARLQDYSDTDDLRQPNGAERADYPNGGPANRRLIRPAEWLSVLGAREATDARRWRQLRNDLAADPISSAINVNTASAEVLKLQFGLTEDQAQAVIRGRESAPYFSLDAMSNVAGVALPLDYEQIYTFPSGSILFTLRDTRSAWIYRGRLSMTPAGLEQPVWIDQTDLTEAPRRAVADTSNATRLNYAPR